MASLRLYGRFGKGTVDLFSLTSFKMSAQKICKTKPRIFDGILQQLPWYQLFTTEFRDARTSECEDLCQCQPEKAAEMNSAYHWGAKAQDLVNQTWAKSRHNQLSVGRFSP